MNKKRVALALAAALGINTLMVTVGQVGGQLTVAHAQNARLIGDQLSQFNVTSFDTLNTTVKAVSDKDAEVTFNNIDLSTIESVNKVTFTHDIFDEREVADIDGTTPVTGVEGTWDATNKKLTVTGMSKPGIYTAKVTINLVGGGKKVFDLSLVKKPVDVVDFTTTLTDKALTIDKLSLNGTTFTPKSAQLYYNGTVQDVTFNGGKAVISILGTQLRATEKLTLKVKYGKNGEYEVSSDILIVNQDKPELKSKRFVTNTANLATEFGTEIASELVGATAKEDVNGEKTTLKVTYNGVEVNALTYEQSRTGAQNAVLGGAELTINDGATANSIDVSVKSAGVDKTAKGPFAAEKANYVPVVGVDYGAGANSVGLIGSYYFAINGEKSHYFEGATGTTGKLEPLASGTNADTKVIYSKDGGTTSEEIVKAITTPLTSSGKTNKISIDVVNSFSHGYNAIPVEFTVDAQSDETKFNTANVTVSGPAAANKGAVQKQNADKTVKTSVIVGVDKLDTVVANAKFEKTGVSSGTLTITGNGLTADANTKLTVSGATTHFNQNASSSTKLVFKVQFDKDITDSNIGWTLVTGGQTLSGKVDLATIEGVNATVIAKNNDTSDTFTVDATFADSTINSGIKRFKGTNNTSDVLTGVKWTTVSLDNGNAVTSQITSGKYQGTYSAGVWAVEQPMKSVISTVKDSKSSTQVDLTIDATFKNEKDYENVQKAVIEYRKVGDTNWTKGLDLTTGANSDLSNDAPNGKTITKTVTANYETEKEYEFRVVYTYKDVKNPIVSNVVKTKISKTLASGNNNGTITGNGSSSSTTGTSTGSTTISVNTNNSTLSGTSASVKLPSGFRYDSGKTPVAVTFKYKDKDGKVVTETKEQFSNVTAKFNGDNVEVNGLVPGKNYDEITVDYTDNNGRTRSIILRNIQTSTTVESDKYLANVYTVVFDRPADEAGYHFHLDNLKNKRVSLREFLLNMLSEKEFIEKYKSTEQKVEALYSAIVARSSDEAGKKFWVEEYNKALKVYGSESTALRAIADRMVNENELKELADKMGVQW